MLFEGGILYGGENSPGFSVDTLNIVTGAATVGPGVTGSYSSFFGLAPNPLPLSVPEGTTLGLLAISAFGLLCVRKIVKV